MISPEEEASVLERAYVPEHIVKLMTGVSQGEPFLRDDHLLLTKDNWIILVGYPLDGNFVQERCEALLKEAAETFRPRYLWFIGPEIPPSLLRSAGEIQRDRYYRLDLGQSRSEPRLKRIAEGASREARVERGNRMTREHEALISELLERENLPPRIRELYQAMPRYLTHSSTAYVLNARGKDGRLTAFFIIELGANHFSTYVVGCHSKRHYVPHASDLLFLEMINLTRDCGKKAIHLGLGVNEGIRRFKEKWGGVPYIDYESCERDYGYIRTGSLIAALSGKL
jgi:hypothetical protein